MSDDDKKILPIPKLDLLKTYTKNIEEQVEVVKASKNKDEYTLEISKLMGLCTGMAIEASLLTEDCALAIKSAQTQTQPNVSGSVKNILEKSLFQTTKKN